MHIAASFKLHLSENCCLWMNATISTLEGAAGALSLPTFPVARSQVTLCHRPKVFKLDKIPEFYLVFAYFLVLAALVVQVIEYICICCHKYNITHK